MKREEVHTGLAVQVSEEFRPLFHEKWKAMGWDFRVLSLMPPPCEAFCTAEPRGYDGEVWALEFAWIEPLPPPGPTAWERLLNPVV